ncbi:hypothetical protein BVRB_4g071880 [Beta vulgaris subsp. vulgaris]|nr:hypothetical protein BVRB_4g071880 [Beta vulgaris subsp. vulgaris]
MAELQLQEDEQLLMKILVRLPVKSLIRFTCVCKYWQSIIQSPKFVTKHYSTRSNLSEYDSILSVFKPGCSISIFNYHDLTSETTFKFRPAVAFDPLRYEIYHRDIISDFSIVGPCNGLFLIQLCKGFELPYKVRMLWNPATRELFKLPEIPNGGCYYFGFGFDAVTHDYKVVGLNGYSDDGVHDNRIVWLYSLAANSWRRVFNACMYLSHHCFYTMVNGVDSSCNGRMHNWILHDDMACQWRDRLLSFDMVDEVLVETPLPSDAPSAHGFLYQGSNHMYPTIFWVGADFRFHVWDLHQYGPTGVWNKVLTVEFPERWLGIPYMVLWKNKEIVFSYLGKLSSLNLGTKQMKSLEIPVDDRVLAYTESLVSISRFVGQTPPTMDHSSDETVSVPLLLVDKGLVVDDQTKFFPYEGISVYVGLSTMHSSDESVPLQLGDDGPVDDQQATQQMKCIRIPADDNLAYTESLVSTARSPTMDNPSDESVPFQLGDEGPVDDQQHMYETTMIHQMLHTEDDDSDDSSIDSAFLTPHITAFTDPSTIYIDYDADAEFFPLRRNEIERLSKLPYCLHEINKPMIPNCGTF